MKEAGLKDYGAANRFDPNLKARVDKTPPTIENHPKTIEGIQAQMASSKK